MRKILITLCAATAVATAGAQTIALGERAPEIRTATWLAGRRPAAAPLTYVEFFHAPNRASLASLDHLRQLSDKSGTKLRVVVVSRTETEAALEALKPYLTERFGVTFDPEGRAFAAYGVSYVPFGVLLDARNRACWMGNTLSLTPSIIANPR